MSYVSGVLLAIHGCPVLATNGKIKDRPPIW